MPESALMKSQRRLREADAETREHKPCIVCESPIIRREGERACHYWQREVCSRGCKQKHIKEQQAARRIRIQRAIGNASQGPNTRMAPEPTPAAIRLIDKFLRYPVPA